MSPAIPVCPLFGACGGCDRQQVPYDEQVTEKHLRLAALLGREPAAVAVHAGAPYGYRNRMDFVCHPEGLGFMARGTWKRVIDVPHCPISNDGVNRLLAEVRAFIREQDTFDPLRRHGTFKYAVIRAATLRTAVTFILNAESPGRAAAEAAVRGFAAGCSADNVLCGVVARGTPASVTADYAVVKGDDRLIETVADRPFRYPVQGFFQTNTVMARRLVGQVVEWLAPGGAALLDLYGGVGTFGITAAGRFAAVRIVELDGPAVTCAAENIAAAGLTHVAPVAAKSRLIHMLGLENPDLHAVTDPPRSGMCPRTLTRLIALRPVTINYVSCNPEQLARELPAFHAAGYAVTEAAIFDLFPQTPHCEVAVRLARTDAAEPQ